MALARSLLLGVAWPGGHGARMRDRHDKLFRYMFSRPEHAAELVRTALPPAVVAHLDLDSLTLENTSFVDQALGERRADLLYRARLAAHDAYLYILIEHQSSEDALMPFRFVHTMIAIWTHYPRDRPVATTLPFIVPLLVYQGSERGPWRAPRRLSELFELPAELRETLRQYGMNLDFMLDDLGAVSDRDLRARAMNLIPTLALWALARIRYSVDIVSDLRSVADLLTEVCRLPGGKDSLLVVIRYIWDSVEATQEDGTKTMLTMEQFLQEIIREANEYQSPMTTADKIHWQGRQEGCRAGQLGLVRKQLEVRFGELPPVVLRRLEQAGLDELEAIGVRLLSAPSLDDVMGELP